MYKLTRSMFKPKMAIYVCVVHCFKKVFYFIIAIFERAAVIQKLPL